MDIVRLPPGEAAPASCDCIQLQERTDGRFDMTGTVLFRCGDGNEAESISITRSEPYASYDDAEAAGLAWAAHHCVERIFVVRSDGTAELPDIFAQSA